MSIRKIELWAVVAAMLAVGFTSTAVARPDDGGLRRAESRLTQSLEVDPSSLPGLVLTGETDSAEFRIAYFDDETGSAEIYFQCSGDSQIASCEAPNDVFMNDGDTAYVWVTFTASDTTGSAQLALTAEWPGGGGQGDTDWAFFTVSPAVEVIADDVPSSVLQYAEDDSATFLIVNNRASADSMSFACVWAGGSCSAPAPILVAATDTSDVTVHFGTGPITGDHDLSLTATSSTSQGSDTATVSVGAFMTVTSAAIVDPVYSEPSAVDTAYFFVRFPGQTGATFDLEWSCGGGLTGCPSPSDTTVGDEGLAVPVSYTAGTNGDTSAITLTVTHSDNATITASATLDVIATSGILFTVDDANPGLELNRGDCLNVSAGAISIVCDDVQYVYPFMPVMRMNRPRQVGLIFNGGIARPGGVVGANFVLPPGATEPDSIRFNLDIDGTDQGTWTYVDDLYEPGVKTRVSRPWSWVTPYGTQLRDYVYTMTPFYGASPGTDMIATGHLIDLDHRFTFGVGWWLAGYERLAPVTDSILGDVLIWTGGDASTRAYIEEGADTFVAWTRGRPDTVMVNQDSTYTRHLLGGGAVHFNALGVHQTTEDANGNETHFDYGMYPFPVAIRTATPAGTDTIYKLENDSQGVDLLVRDEEGGWNEYRLNMTACEGAERQITSIVAPDSTVVEFAWQGAEGSPSCGYELDHVMGETDVITEPSYNSGSVRGVHLYAPEDTTFIDYEAARTVGSNTWSGHVYKPRPAAAVSAYVNGPLDTYGDSTRFFTTAWGAVRGIRDAYGFETWIERDDPSYPAFPTRVRHPNGWELTTTLDAFGFPQTVVDRSTGGVTRQFWDPTKVVLDSIISPEGLVSRFGYDANGNREIEALGPDTTTFAYDSLGLVESVTDAGGHTTTYGYDPSDGNMELLVTPQPDTTWFARDDLGRVVRRISQVDSVSVVIDSTTYDVMGRERLRHTRDGTNSEWMKSETTYDTFGRPIAALAWGSIPESEDTDTLPLNEWEYDTWGRVSVEKSGTTDSLFYDRANNLIRRVTGRGESILHYYDVLSRLDSTVVDSVFYAYNQLGGHINPAPILEPSGLTIPGDTSVFTYDAMGNLTSATNSVSQITRTYDLAGRVRTDQLAMKNWGNSVMTNHVYPLAFDYDLDGRRVALHHPEGMLASDDPTIYGYAAGTGRLVNVTDPLGTAYSFEYDPDGLLETQSYPGGVDSMTYTSTHQLDTHVLTTGGVQRWAEDLTYDLRGKVISSGATYSTLGYVTDPGDITWGTTPDFNFETLANTGLGRVTRREVEHVVEGHQDPQPKVTNNLYDATFGMLEQTQEEWALTTDPAPGGWVGDLEASAADASGNVRTTYDLRRLWSFNNDTTQATSEVEYREESLSFYSADERLVVHQVDRDTLPTPVNISSDTIDVNWGAYERYWYDALGRRILKSSYQEGAVCDWDDRCQSTMERFVWDGDQILAELRQLSATGDQAFPGARIVYTHTGVIDAPVGMIRSGSPTNLHRMWRGLYAFATDTAGEPITCGGTYQSSCDFYPWPGGSPYAYLPPGVAGDTHVWLGSLPLAQQDETGLAYRRNRYYDAGAGQFTQQDPIGIAGGLNLYGYANGDPINFSDPFGLCPPEDDDPCNLDTGDPNLDLPDRRNVMERAFKQSVQNLDADGFARERGGSCDNALSCAFADGTHSRVGVPQVPGAIFEFHTHPNEGLKFGSSGQFIAFPMPIQPSAEDLTPFASSYPGYIIGANEILRLDFNGPSVVPTVTRFDRWNR